MQEIEFAMIRGFDLFFEGASEYVIEAIARDLGGNCSFDPKEMRATYMFSKPRYMLINEIDNLHEMLQSLGERYQAMYKCEFLKSELYLRAQNKGVEIISENKNIEMVVLTKPAT